MSTEPQLVLRQRIYDVLLKASYSDWDVGEGIVIELPLTVAVDAVMTVLAVVADAVAAAETQDEVNHLISNLRNQLGPRTATHGGEVIDPRRNYR